MTAETLKTIKVSDDNHRRLSKRGSWGETMDEIIGRVLDALEACEGKKK
jgi:hypothetical protein